MLVTYFLSNGYTLQLHYNKVLNNADSIITWALESYKKTIDILVTYFLSNGYTLQLHYNKVLNNADSIITRSPRGSQICVQCILWMKMSADDTLYNICNIKLQV